MEATKTRRRRVAGESLDEDERRYFQLVKDGDLDALKDFLQGRQDLDLNCLNFQGLSALHLAVQLGNADTTGFLATSLPGLRIGDALLDAVKGGRLNVIHALLDALREVDAGAELCGYTDSSEFAVEVRPLHVAAEGGDVEVVKTLLRRGHFIQDPHRADCGCEVCYMADEEGPSLVPAQLVQYRALTTAVLICLCAQDPVLRAFNLCEELRACRDSHPEYAVDYQELSVRVQRLPVALLDECRDASEVQTLLRHREGYRAHRRAPWPRLRLALAARQKEFVTHPSVQQLLHAQWLGPCTWWPRLSYACKLWQLCVALLLLLPLSLLFLLLPSHSWTARLRVPLYKFLHSLLAYAIFIGLVFATLALDARAGDKGPPHVPVLPWLLALWMLGHVWQSMIVAWVQGLRVFTNSFANVYELVLESLFGATFLFWLLAWRDARDDADTGRQVPRALWPSMEATLVGEALFSVAAILAFFRLLGYCKLDKVLGPLEVSLEKMLVRILGYLLFLGCVVMVFAVAFHRLYWYYSGMKATDSHGHVVATQTDAFDTFGAALKTLFWAQFCMAAVESADVVLDGGAEHAFTQGVGHMLLAVYHLLVIVIMVNILVAILMRDYGDVQENADMEWKFNRTDLYLLFMDDALVLPPPLNLLPIIGRIKHCFDACKLCCIRHDPQGCKLVCTC